jgi:hypothetical protein
MGILDDAIREHLELKRAHGAAEDEVLRQEAEALGPARREPPPAASFDPAGAEPLVSPPPDPDAAVGFDGGAPPPPGPEEIGPAPELSDAPPPILEEDTALMPAAELPVPDDEDPLAFPSEPVAEEPFDGRTSLEEEPPPALAADEVPLHDQLGAEPEATYEPEPEPEPDPEPEPRAAIDDAETRMRPLPPLDDDMLPPEPARPVEPEPEEPEAEPESAAPPAAEDGEDLLEETPDFLQETPEHDRLWFEQKPPRDFDFDD